MADTQEIRLAFIDVAVFSDGSIRGGILTTDIQTRPYEFRITSPIKPTQMQQILYGTSLKDVVTPKNWTLKGHFAINIEHGEPVALELCRGQVVQG